MVKRLAAWSDHDYVTLTTGDLAGFDRLQSIAERLAKQGLSREKHTNSLEEATAWTLSAIARSLARERAKTPEELETLTRTGIETWVVGYPIKQKALFADWFNFYASGTDYRVIIHRTARVYGAQSIAFPWSGVYHRYIQSKNARPFVRSMHLNVRQRQEAKEFLVSLLIGYVRGPAAVKSLIASSGHRYWYSDGSPNV